MKPSRPPARLPIQEDLFNSAPPSPPALASLQAQHDELVELLSQLLWTVVTSAAEPTKTQEANHEQDQR